MIYSIEKIASLIGARRTGENTADIAFLLTDSRSLCFPEETLFFALQTAKGDGHRYINDLYARGVRNFVVTGMAQQYHDNMSDANFLVVDDTLKALQKLAGCHRDSFHMPVVGITGSNGKTVVKEWLWQVMNNDINVVRSPRSYNSQVGVPLSLWLMDTGNQLALIEAGISKPGEMAALHDIIKPTIGVLTNIGSAHEENFESREAKCIEKLKLFDGAGTVICPGDDPVINACMKEHYHGERITWSEKDPDATLFIKKVTKNGESTEVEYVFQGRKGKYTLPFIDDASLHNSYTVAAVALHLGFFTDALERLMSKLEPVAMRLEVKEGQHGCTLINDSYNADINSLDIALDFMSRRPDHKGRRRTLILSDILQSGQRPEELYKEVNDLVTRRGVQKFIGIGNDITGQAGAIGVGEKFFFPNVDTFTRSSTFRELSNEVILIKGSRTFGFDRLTDMMVEKVHETTLEVNLSAVVENLNHYRSFMKPATKIVCMIKADAYGAGAVEIAKTLQDQRVDYLAVAVADEGVTLRNNGITANIMIMNPEMSAFKTMFDYDLEPEVYSFRLLDALIAAAEREGITDWPVHIKLDTGMHRLGFDPVNDIDRLIERLKSQNAVIPRSVFSHFVGSDSDDFDEFSAHQFSLFDSGSRRLQDAFNHKILRHIDNSAGITHFPERQLDMCRLGLGLYGIDSRNNNIINTVSTLRTTILQLRNVPAGDTVGYSRRGTIDKASVIAAIPIGYADGLNRHLGNRHAYCLVNGKKAEYVGNICMDVAMIDVTGIDCHEGDKVEIFGDNLPVTILSDAIDTIPYEVLTGISNRVKRIYFQD